MSSKREKFTVNKNKFIFDSLLYKEAHIMFFAGTEKEDKKMVWPDFLITVAFSFNDFKT